MKNLLSSLLFVSFYCLLNNAHAATTAELWGNKREVEKTSEQNNDQKNVVMNPSVAGVFNELTRVLSSDPVGSSVDKDNKPALDKNQVQYTKTAYDSGSGGNNSLFLGATKLGTEKKNFVLARASLGTNSKGEVAPTIFPLAPNTVTLNGEKDVENPLVKAGTKITNLTLLNKALPVVTAESEETAGTVDSALSVINISDAVTGGILLQNKDLIKDAAGAEIDKSIVGLAASGTEIFAAVPAQGKDFFANEVNDRGIAHLRAAADDLTIIGDTATKLDAAAYKVPDEVSGVQIAFYDATEGMPIANAQIGPNAAMFWDDKLQRLFIGLNTRRDATNKAGGVLNIAVGRLEKKDTTATTFDILKIAPIVENPTRELFYNDATADTKNVIDRVVGFYFDSVSTIPDSKFNYYQDVFLATDIIRSMHTTTGRDYLITVGRFGVFGDQTEQEVYALPLRGTSADPDGKNPQRVGTLSNKEFSGSPTTFDEMPANNTSRVGGESGSFNASVNIADLFVFGDAVYVCLAGKSGGVTQSREVGIFQSNALFDATGIIIGWTPFTRVMGSLERVFGAGLDNATGSYLFVTETNEADPSKPYFPNTLANNISTIRQSSWGKTDSVNNLTSVLENLFSQNRGGVHQLIAFDEMTPGFSLDGGREHISVMVAVGLERIALIQSGKFIAASNLFVPETNFVTNDPGKNVFVFDDQELRELGPICTADFARSNQGNEGWLFVGGYNGVAVLRQANGNGFDSSLAAPGGGLTELITAGFPGTGYSFLQLIPTNPDTLFDHVRKVACLNRVLYILTEDNVYAVDIANAAGKFDDAGTNDLDEQVIDLTGLPSDAALLDFIPLRGSAIIGSPEFNNFRALLATTKGLYVITRNGLGQHQVREVLVNNKSLGTVIQLQYLSQTKGTPSLQGNLYVLAADITTSPAQGKVYRFAVDANQADVFVTPIPPNNGLVADLADFRSNLFADGSTILHTRGKHFGDANYLNAQPTTDVALVQPLTAQLALNELNTNIGAVIRESASGALYAPGDWGVRAHL